MKHILLSVAMIFSVGAATAQTYDEIIAGGGVGNISNMERNLGAILQRHGVSSDCLGNLTVSDAGQINSIVNSDDAQRTKEQRVQVILDRRC